MLAFSLASLVYSAVSETNGTATNETNVSSNTFGPSTLSDLASSDLSPTITSSTPSPSVVSGPDVQLFTGSEWEPFYATRLNPYNMDTDPYGNPWPEICGEVWSSSFYQWVETASLASFTPAMEVTTETITEIYSTETETLPLYQWDDTYRKYTWIGPVGTVPSSTTTTTIIHASLEVPSFTPSPPCCRVGCSFTFGDASVYQWPITNHPPSFSTLTNLANNTL